MSFRLGQKVVCIVDSDRWICGRHVRPKKGCIYTVRSVLPADHHGPESIRLYEIVNPSTSAIGEPAYFAAGFRLIEERETDIGFAHEILRKVSKVKETTA
ncbi:MAG: hypothetical protein J0H40_17910 [Rhizobiales bacterium]|nr:hypothetical protein [Hyphomicrobiales bacterium]